MTDFDAAEITARALERGEDPLSSVLGQAVGAASACWENLAGAGVFESERAKAIVDVLVDWVAMNYVHRSYAGHAPNRLEPGDRLLLAGPAFDAASVTDQLRKFVAEDFDIGVVDGVSDVVVASKAWVDWRRGILERDLGLADAAEPVEVEAGVELPGLKGLLEHFGIEGTPVISHSHNDMTVGPWPECPACIYIAGQATRLPLEHITLDDAPSDA